MPSFIMRDPSAVERTATAFVMRDSGNTPRTAVEIWVRDLNNVPRLVFNPSGSLTLAVATDVDAVQGRSHGTGTATTGAVVATATGGTAPYTYAWSLVSTDGSPDPTANSPTSATTTFTQTGMSSDDFVTTTWRITVTDSLSVTASTTIIASFSDYTSLIGTP